MNWWSENHLRLIQTNISEENADLDVDLLITQLKDFSANTLMLNTGGIEAFYPTKLEYHYKSPYLKKDLVQEVVQKCHENKIKFIARFDFSKAHESIFLEQPDWFYRTKDKEIVNYNQMVHTCVNGFYQREYSLKIMEEVIEQYAVDGIFFLICLVIKLGITAIIITAFAIVKVAGKGLRPCLAMTYQLTRI